MRILIVGLGSIGQRHVRNLRALLGDQVELMAVRVRGLNHILTDTLQVEAPDGFVREVLGICVSHYRAGFGSEARGGVRLQPEQHAYRHCAGARAGRCHLFIEKPLAHEHAGVEELIEIVERKRLVATVGISCVFIHV